jgi:signal transduction histidine kinase
MLSLILLFCGIVLIVLSIVVIYSNYTAASNRWLSAFIFSGFLWLLANLLANTSTTQSANLFYSKAALIGASLSTFTFLMFCIRFVNRKISKTAQILISLPIILLLLTTPTALNIKSVSLANDTINPGPSYVFLLIVLIAYFGYGTYLLLKEYRRSTQNRHQQLYYILLGTFLTFTPAAILSAVLPVLGESQGAAYAPALVIFFAIFTTVAIVKHRLFDVRLVIARSLGYATSLLFLSSLYGFIVLGAARIFFGLQISFWQQLLLSIATGLTGLGFQRFRSYFDKITNRLFYQDAYDPRELFDELNKTLVSSLEIDFLMETSVKIISKNLKPRSCFIGLRDGATDYRLFGVTSKDAYSPKEVARIRELTIKRHERVIAVDYLDSPRDAELKEIMQNNEISVLVRLTQNTRVNEEGLGYLALGYKKSGNPYNKQDFRTLEAVANDLVLAIQNALHFEEIQKFNITLQARVDDATSKLRKTNEKLKELDETKDDFISMASHQLRTPLTSVKGYLSMVMEGDAGKLNKTQTDMLGQAYFSSQRMVYLISDLLNVSRLKTGKFVIEPTKVNLATMVDQEMKQLHEAAAARNLTLSFDRPDDFPDVMLDETKTRQVIMNFADNAIYYTPAGGHVRVRLLDTPTTIEFRVEDNGIGVAKSDQPHLFTKFYRAGNARKARPDGTGLGLFMAKKVIAAEEGSLIFESEEGKGSTFGFVFSKAKVGVKPESTPVTDTPKPKIKVVK